MPGLRTIITALACASGACKASSGPDHTYEIQQLDVASTESDATAVAVDLDGDGLTDNAFGLSLAIVQQGLGPDVNLRALENAEIGTGQVITLIDVRTPDLGQAGGVALTEYEGAQQMDGSIEVDPGSPLDVSMTGAIANGSFTGGPGDALLAISLFDSAPIPLHLYGAHATFVAGDQGLDQGVLAGGILGADLTGQVLPAIADGMSGQIAADCPGDAPPSCGCTAGSRGAAYVTGFDTAPADCSISADELATSATLQTLLVPDVLIGPSDAPCLSFAIGFAAQPVSYAVP